MSSSNARWGTFTGKQFLKLATEHGISQHDVAKALGTNLSTLRRREDWKKEEIKILLEMIYTKTGTAYDIEQTIRNMELPYTRYQYQLPHIQGRFYIELAEVQWHMNRVSPIEFVNRFGISGKEVETAHNGVPRFTLKCRRKIGLDIEDLVLLSEYVHTEVGLRIHPLDFASRYIPFDKIVR